jgi:hypothetical protein
MGAKLSEMAESGKTLMSSERNDEECDATEADQGYIAGLKI